MGNSRDRRKGRRDKLSRKKTFRETASHGLTTPSPQNPGRGGPLSRSSIEAYLFGLLSLLIAVAAMTWLLRALLILVMALILADLSLRSSWTLRFGVWRYLILTASLFGLISATWAPTYEQYIQSTEPHWCYAFFYKVYPPWMEQKLHLGVVNPSSVPLHNVELTATNKSNFTPPGPERMKEDIEHFTGRQSAFLPVVYPIGSNGLVNQTALLFDYAPPTNYDISFVFEGGEAVTESILVAPTWQCIISITRVRDGKVLKQNVLPQMDMAAHRTSLDWGHCQ